MSFDYKAEKPLLNSSLIFTSSNLQTKSPLRDNSPEKFSDSKLSTPNIQARKRLTQYGHNLSKIPISYHPASLQTKLTIGQPGDKYEQEADKVSEQVMNMSQPIQRQENREDEMQMKPEIQRAEMPKEEEEEENMQAKSLANVITPLVQREQIPKEEEEENIQAKSDSATASMEGLEQQLNNSKGGGTPLSDEARTFMEPRFGTDFSNVKVHTDSSSVHMNQDIQAQAFTQGQDIYFNSGKYSPDTDEGKSLLAHELTHVVQQRGGE